MNQNPETRPAATATPLDGKSLAIGVLSVTACVLFVGYVLLLASPRSAYAIGTSDRGGDYVMVTQQLSNSQEAVVLIDAAARRMNVYGYDFNQKVLRAIDLNIELDKLPGAQAPVNPPPANP